MTTIDEQVGASLDDTQHRLTSHIFFSLDTLIFAAGAPSSGAHGYGAAGRFTTVAIGNGDTVDTADLIVTPRISDSDTTALATINADDADDSPRIANDTDWDNIVHTTASVDWTVPAFVLDVEQTSPEIKTVIQEIVDRAGWASGNSMTIFFEDEADASTAGAYRPGHSYDSSTTKAPKLHIEFTAAAVGRRIFITHG